MSLKWWGLAALACACSPAVNQTLGAQVVGGVRMPQFGILDAPMSHADVNHYTYELRDNVTNALIKQFKTLALTVTFNEVPDGTYKLVAEAFKSQNDTVSITQGGAQTSSNTVTVASPNVNYSAGGALTATLTLADGTGEYFDNELTVNDGDAWAGAAGGALVATNQWTNGYAGIPTGVFAPASAVLGDQLYVIGGCDGGTYVDTVAAFNPRRNSWSLKGSLLTARQSAAAAVVGGKIYVMGGTDNLSVVLDSVEEYDPATDNWTAKAPMPTARYGLAVAVVGGQIYAIGGRDVSTLATVEMYDPATNTWTAKSDMPTTRLNLVAGAVGTTIYAIGGNGGSGDVVEAYDTVANGWSAKASMPTARVVPALAEIGGKLIVAGGQDFGNNPLTVTEVYDPVSNSWTTKANAPTARFWQGYGMIGDFLLVAGGHDGISAVAMVERYEP